MDQQGTHGTNPYAHQNPGQPGGAYQQGGYYGSPGYAPPPPKKSNALGLTGFILSLLSPCTCGLLAPIALLLSIIGLFKEPRGLATAGTVISLLVVLGCGGMWGMAGFQIMSDINKLGGDWDFYWDADDIDTAAWRYSLEHNAPPPSLSAAGVYGDGTTDKNGVPYVYRLTEDGRGYSLHGAGADQVFNTPDDVNLVDPDASDFTGEYAEYYQGSAELPEQLIPEGH